MHGIGPWAAGGAMTLLALIGLGMASRAVDTPFYLFGLALFVLGVGCVFGLVIHHTGHRPPARHGTDDVPGDDR